MTKSAKEARRLVGICYNTYAPNGVLSRSKGSIDKFKSLAAELERALETNDVRARNVTTVALANFLIDHSLVV